MFSNPNTTEPIHQGDPVDKKLKDGPYEHRERTDFTFCIIFLVFVVIYTLLAIFVGFKTDLTAIYQGYDRNGYACGKDEQVKDYPILLAGRNFGTYNQDTEIWDCVKRCPPVDELIECAPLQNQGSLCGMFVKTKTTTFHGKICLADKGVSDLFNNSFIVIADQVGTYWWAFPLCTSIAILAGVIILFWIRYGAKCMIWSSIFVFLGLCAVLGLAFLYISSIRNIALGIFFLVLGAITGALTCCFRHTISFLCGIISASAEFIRANPLITLLPILGGVFNAVVGLLWIFVYLKTYFYGEVQRNPDISYSHQAIISYASIRTPLFYFNYFAYLWIGLFFMHTIQFIICSTASLWYFTCGTEQQPISKSIKRTLTYHLGSIAFGSFILAAVKFLRTLAHKAEQDGQANGNAAVQLIACLLKCILAIVEKIIQFLGLHAYIEIALTGKNFCDAAKDGFFLVMRNAVRFGVSIKMFEWFEFLSAVYILLLSLPISIFIVIKTIQQPSAAAFFVLFCVIISLLVAFLFSILIVFGAHTILHCYCIDYEISEQEGKGAAKFAPPVLQDAIRDYQQSQK